MALHHYAIISAAIAVYAIFSWGVVAHFRRPAGITPLTFAMGFSVTALTVAQVLRLRRIDPGVWATALALVGYAVSLALYLWAVRTTRTHRPSLAFSGDTPARLIADGPYRHVRHPFYASYVLYWLAGSVALRESWLMPAMAAVAALYVLAALHEERTFERSPNAEAYHAYRRSTGMFLPRLTAPR